MGYHIHQSAVDRGVVVQRIIQKAVTSLLNEQATDGSWQHGFEMGIMPDAQTASFLYLLNYRDPIWIQGLIDRMRETQNTDGSWSPYPDSPGDLSTTVECYYAMTLYDAWDEYPDERLATEQFILRSGGLKACRNLTKMLLAIGGEISWIHLPSPTLYAWLWSDLSPVKMQDIVTFTRLHIASMIIVSAHQYVSPVVSTRKLGHLMAYGSVIKLQRRSKHKRGMSVPTTLLRRCMHYLNSQRELDGTLAGYHSSTFLFLFAQLAMGYELTHPDIRQTVNVIRRSWGCPFGEAKNHQQTCDAHIWNTALTLRAVRDAGLPLSHSNVRSAMRYLVNHQHISQWDAYHQAFTMPGGWGFSSNNTRHPDTDDTVACLEALADASDCNYSQWQLGVQWLISRQNSDGGWSAFDQNCGKRWMENIPSNDMRHAIADPSTPDITARVIEFSLITSRW